MTTEPARSASSELCLVELWATNDQKFPWRLTTKVAKAKGCPLTLARVRLFNTDEKATAAFDDLAGRINPTNVVKLNTKRPRAKAKAR